MQGMFGEVWNLWKIQSQVHLKTMAWGSLKPNHIVVRIRWGGYPHAALHAELQLSCDSLFQVLWCRGKGCYGQWWRWNTLLIYETKLSSDWSTVISSHFWCKCLHWEHQRLKKNPLYANSSSFEGFPAWRHAVHQNGVGTKRRSSCLPLCKPACTKVKSGIADYDALPPNKHRIGPGCGLNYEVQERKTSD